MGASKVAATNAAIVNAVRNNASEQYRARIPETTDNNLTKTLALLQENSLLWNEFIQVLVQRIGLTLFRTNSFENRLKPFKTGAMAYGGVVQEIGANLIKAKAYDPNDTNVFGADKPDVKAIYHSVNRRDRYDLRLNEDMLEEDGITCPNCGTELEFDFDGCDCGCCHGEDDTDADEKE